jgi:HEAT repeat protein
LKQKKTARPFYETEVPMRKILIASSLCLGIALLGRCPSPSAADEETPPKPEPMVFGKSLSTWMEGLKNPDPGFRILSVYAIGRMGGDAADAVPKLLKAYQEETDQSVRMGWAWALKRVDPEAAAKAGIR